MINRLKQFFGSPPAPPGPTHKIVRCETQVLNSQEGPKAVILMGADLYVPGALDALMTDLAERFKVHRMISPPETSVLLITILGPCQLLDVVARWQKLAKMDKIVGVWMARMEKADIGVGPANGEVSATCFHSILPDKNP